MTSGSSVMVVWEGTRPLLVEIQALVDHSMMANPRRVAVGLEQNRLAILLAVLHRHGGLQMADQVPFDVLGKLLVLLSHLLRPVLSENPLAGFVSLHDPLGRVGF